MYLSRLSNKNKYVLLAIMCFILFAFHSSHTNNHKTDVKLKNVQELQTYFANRQTWNTSNLGSVLFKNKVAPNSIQKTHTYKILVWRYWKWLQNRHVFNYNKQRNSDPLRNCRVKNCIFNDKDEDINIADAVVVHIQHGLIPNVTTRNRNQRWIFLSDESPKNAFSMAKVRPKLKDLAGVFNWSMTYRSDSDVPVPYGRTIPSRKPLLDIATDLGDSVPFWKKKRRDVMVSILISNCKVSRRTNYLKDLQKYITVDVYGKCSENHKKSCPGHFTSDCKMITEYVFYLVFENSECHEYLTEKGFYHAYSKGAIPIVMGPSLMDCEMLLPPNSYLHVDNYKNVEDLAKHIEYISKSDSAILKYHDWRRSFEVVNEHGYFGSPSLHYCRVCEALNYNDKREKVYDEKMLRVFLEPSVSCR